MKTVAATLLLLATTLAEAAELTLFDVPLGSSSRAQLQAAIEKAGGKLVASTRDLERYDVTGHEVVYLNNNFVLAQYAFSKHGSLDERLHKIITSQYCQPKYGRPKDGQPKGVDKFDQQYLRDGQYRWRFAQQMELVYTKEFFGERFLTYVNRTEQEKLNQLVQHQDSRAAPQQATKLNSVFQERR